jgi:ribonuclease P protein component
MNNMLSAENRLRKKIEVERALRKGKSVFDDACGFRFIKNDMNFSRATVVVGTKLSKKAVVRNRLKRQYRDILRQIWPEISPGFDVVLFPGSKAIQKTHHEKLEALRLRMKKVGLC